MFDAHGDGRDLRAVIARVSETPALARAIRNMEAQQQSPPAWREERRHHGSRMSGWVGGDDDV